SGPYSGSFWVIAELESLRKVGAGLVPPTNLPASLGPLEPDLRVGGSNFDGLGELGGGTVPPPEIGQGAPMLDPHPRIVGLLLDRLGQEGLRLVPLALLGVGAAAVQRVVGETKVKLMAQENIKHLGKHRVPT